MNEIEVPKEWKLTKLGEITNSIYGYTEKAHREPVGIPYLRITDIDDNGELKQNRVYVNISPKKFLQYKLEKGDILIARSGSVGKSFLFNLDDDFVFASYLIRFKPVQTRILPEFLIYLLKSNSFFSFIGINKTTSSISNVNAKNLRNFEFYLPPIETQKKIISKLNSVLKSFEEKKKEISNLKRINIEKIKHLIENRDSIIISKIIPDDNLGSGWSLLSIGEILESKLQGMYYNKGYYLDGVPLLRITDMDDFGNIMYENLPKVHVNDKEIDRYGLKKGDIVMARTGSSRGKMVVFNRENFDLLFAGYLIRFRFKKNVNPDYVRLCFKHPKINRMLLSTSHGGATQNINAENLKQIKIPFSNLVNQNNVVRQFEKSFREMDVLLDTLERIVQIQAKTLSNLNYLQMSILSDAFSGKIII